MNIDEIIRAKETSHGHFDDTATIAQTQKAVMRRGRNWEGLVNPSKESLEMIATKIARILNGDPNDPEHWNDIAGYARIRAIALVAASMPRATVTFNNPPPDEVETGISQIAKRLRPVINRVNDEGGVT